MRTTPISAAAMTYGRSVDVGAENTRLSRMAAAHAVFDSVEEGLECGCRLAIRRCRDLNCDHCSRPRQKALPSRSSAVELDPANVQTRDLEHRVPRRALDLETPGVAGVQLDLAIAHAT